VLQNVGKDDEVKGFRELEGLIVLKIRTEISLEGCSDYLHVFLVDADGLDTFLQEILRQETSAGTEI